MDITLSVCIPAYNRSEVLAELLDSILTQDYEPFEIVICEDNSPQRDAIRAVVQRYIAANPGRIHYYENEQNLGYDANLRNLIEKSTGKFCFFMGNDDLMSSAALATVSSALERYKEVGVILRSYASFDGTPDNINQTFRYFDREIFFPAGPSTITTFYRRSIVIPGVVVSRSEALKFSTDRFDGTLLYQLYLVANILVEMNGIFLPEILALYRNGGIPDFGNSEKEQGRFVPQEQTPESSLHFMRGMLDIAAWVETSRNLPVYDSILKDIANYSYPILAIQSRRSLQDYVKYSFALAKMGFGTSGMFYAYFFAILLLGTNRVDALIRLIKQHFGYTPTIGAVFRGEAS
jgi:glycosyltransferase involved in cell wall biosynthesis